MKELKFVYESTVKKLVEEKVTEKQELNGQQVEVSRTVKKVKPVKIAIVKPNRRQSEMAEIFYARHIADYLKQGLLPQSLVAKRYDNDGGALSEPNKQKLEVLKVEAEELEKQFYALSGNETENEKRNNILTRINKINNEVTTIQSTGVDIYDHTAEVKARNKTIEWWVLYLAYIDEDGKGYKPLFGDGTYEQKLEKYDDFIDLEDAFYNEAIKKISYLASFWLAARGASLTKIDFESIDKLYEDTISEYKVEDPEVKKEEPPAEPPAEPVEAPPTTT